MERVISPVGEEWQAAEASAIADWERSAGYALPADYRAFLVGYDGGRPYPNMFSHTALVFDDAAETEHFVDPFYAWDRVVAWSHELGNRLPAGCLAIGADPGLVEIVLSLRDEDFGATYSWVRNWAGWGSAENSYLCPQAPSFAAFVAGLFDDDQRTGHDYWHTPRRERLQRRLEV